ncbi:MAG: hypothetical protein EOM05_12250, partial [Clostridia bacterium]|nr:hypothetical protein [Clostridia bacterium]
MNNGDFAGYTGLTANEVNERVAEGKINGDQNIKTKTIAQIFRTNLFTFFNFLFVIFAAILAVFLDFGEDGKL